MHLKDKFHCRTENGKLRLFIHPATYFNKNIMHGLKIKDAGDYPTNGRTDAGLKLPD